MIQLLNLFNRRLYKQDLFTVYLSGLNPNIYINHKKFNKFPIGDIIIEINGKTFDNYNTFISIVTNNLIENIKTIDNKIYFI